MNPSKIPIMLASLGLNKEIKMKINFQILRAGRLERLVREELPFVRRAFLQKLFRKREIKVGNSPRKFDSVVSVNENITVFLPEPRKNFREITGCEILFEDTEVIAFNKSTGITTHKGVGTHGKTLREAAEALLDLKLTVVHRLDRETSGVLIFAKTKKAAQKFAEEFRKRRTEKIYHAIISRIPKNKSGVINFPLKKVGERIVVAKNDGKSAETCWQLIRKFKDSTLVEIKLITGRTHQIRVHFTAIGHSVIGDTLYGTVTNSRMLLHASKLKILNYTFEAKLPKEFDC